MTQGPIKTFSVGYAEQSFSELGYAAELAQAIGTEHRDVVIGAGEFFDALPRLIWHEDEPITWPSSVSLYFVSRLAAEHVKVVLTGEGADEMFGGYGRYKFFLAQRPWMDRYARVPAGVRSMIGGAVANSSLLTASVRRKLQHTFIGREPGLESFYLDNFYSAFSRADQRVLLKRTEGIDPYRSFGEIWKDAGSRTGLNQLLYADQKSYLVALLMKQDRMSMAASIESRVPFLDHLFVEFAAAVPDRMKIRGNTGKYILKQAVRDLLPPAILSRRKMGFPTPLKAWLQGPHANGIFDLLRDPDGLLANYVHRSALDTLLDRHVNGRIDATDRIWRLLNLQLWGRVFLSGRPDSVPFLHDENPVGQV
jgi:asparagine synthase (glutamine-hydrolysing)